MDTSKLSVGDQIAAASGLVLLIVLFLPWYGVDVNVGGFSASESVNAWEAMGFIDILLFLIALVGDRRARRAGHRLAAGRPPGSADPARQRVA